MVELRAPVPLEKSTAVQASTWLDHLLVGDGDLRHTWASWLRQHDVPTWVLQELGGWKSEVMVRRYAHMSVKHLQPYADQLIFKDAKAASQVSEKIEADGPKNGHRAGPPRLYLVA